MLYRKFLNIVFVLGCSAQLFSAKNSCFALSKEFCLTTAECNPCGCDMSQVRKSVALQYGLAHKDFKRPRAGFTCKQCALPVAIAAGACCLCSEVVRTDSRTNNTPAHHKPESGN